MNVPHAHAATDCEGCGEQIGNEPFLLATDGVSGKLVAFHKKCDPRDQDLQRHHKVTLAPGRLGFTPKDL